MRKPIVSRKLKGTIYNVVCIFNDTGQPVTTELTLYGIQKKIDDAAALKLLQRQTEGTNIKPVHINSSRTVNKLFGMDPDEFFKHAVELDPETRKPITESEKGE